MTVRFDPSRGLIIVAASMHGPAGHAHARLALDTGATGTMLSSSHIAALGYDTTRAERVNVTTGSGVEYAPRLPVERISALGAERRSFPIICHTLPPSAAIDGLLGLDFFRGMRLSIDFRRGTLTLR